MTRSTGRPPTSIVFVLSDDGMYCVTVPSPALATQIALSEAAIPSGPWPTATSPSTRGRASALTRTTLSSALTVTQTSFSATTTLSGFSPTSTLALAPLAGSMRVSVPSRLEPTHTARAPTATPSGRAPTGNGPGGPGPGAGGGGGAAGVGLPAS